MNKKTLTVLVLVCVCFLAMQLVAHGPTPPEKSTVTTISFSIGDNSIVDRGYQSYNQGKYTVVPTTYRYQTESFGNCLYLYDDAGMLKARVINPERVSIND